MGKQGTWEWGRGSSNRGRGTYDVCMHVDGGRVGFGRAPLEIRRRCWRRTAMRDDVRTLSYLKPCALVRRHTTRSGCMWKMRGDHRFNL